jgi:hypothetical protein
MTIKDRIKKLVEENFYVYHKALENTQMQENLDYVRIYNKSKQWNAI